MSSDEERDIVADHAELIGRVAIAWNDLNHMLSILFQMLSGLPADKARAIYFTPRSDTAQREILTAVGKAALEVAHPALWTSFKICMDGIGPLSGERNAAIHTSWVLVIPENKFAPSPAMPKHKALQTDFAQQFGALKERLGNKFFELNEIRKALLQCGFG